VQTLILDAMGTAVRIEGDDGRFYGVVERDKRNGRWRTKGAAIGPLAVWHDDPKGAIDALVDFQESREQ
jgi:hypothetical protein